MLLDITVKPTITDTYVTKSGSTYCVSNFHGQQFLTRFRSEALPVDPSMAMLSDGETWPVGTVSVAESWGGDILVTTGGPYAGLRTSPIIHHTKHA